MRFYGIDPLRLAEIAEQPELWGILERSVEALRAEEMLNGVNVASMPHAKRGEQRSFRRKLEKQTKVYEPVKPRLEEEPVERDPQKAKDWFRLKGVQVVKDE